MTETAKGMLSHRRPVVHSTGYLIASWDDCKKSSYAGPQPKHMPTEEEDRVDRRSTFFSGHFAKMGITV